MKAKPDFDQTIKLGSDGPLPRTADFLNQLTPEAILAPLRLIHRASDCYVGFGRNDQKGDWQGLFSYRVNDLEKELPDLLPWLGQDAYFTVNSMYRPAPYRNKITGRPDVWRKEEHLRYLNACYVDLDVGRDSSNSSEGSSLTCEEASMAVSDMIAEGQLPQSSLFTRSGRGAYVYWLLHSEDDCHLPPRSYPEKVRLYKSLNRVLAEKLQHLCADSHAIDGARVLRVPGTLHSKSGHRATYTIQHYGDGQPISYTMSELMQALTVDRPFISLPGPMHFSLEEPVWTEIEETGTIGIATGDINIVDINVSEVNPGEVHHTEDVGVSCPVKPSLTAVLDPPEVGIPETQVFGRQTKNPNSAKLRYKGAVNLNRQRADELLRIYRRRGGWQKGTRRRSLSIFAMCCRNIGDDKVAVFKKLRTMAQGCQLPYPSDRNDESLESIVERTFDGRIKKLRTEKIMESIRLTDDEAWLFGLQTLLSDSLRAKWQRPYGGYREQKRKQRRAFIEIYLQKYGMASCRQLVIELKRAHIIASQQTVNEDLRYLTDYPGQAHKSLTRKTAGRPRKQQKSEPSSEPQLWLHYMNDQVINQELWDLIQPLLPAAKPHPLNCHRPRFDDRMVMTAIFFVLCTGCKWSDLNSTGICNSSTAHRRFKEWSSAGVFERLQKEELKEKVLKAIAVQTSSNWSWLSTAIVETKIKHDEDVVGNYDHNSS